MENEICNRCGRTLKDAKSKERGYGPKCWKKQQHEEQEENPKQELDYIYISNELKS